MLAIHVFVDVKPGMETVFRDATIDNARNSVQEAGIARFDVLQSNDDPTKFCLVEVYKTPDAPAAHKETSHYRRWRDTVAPMMNTPRTNQKFSNVYPDENGWEVNP